MVDWKQKPNRIWQGTHDGGQQTSEQGQGKTEAIHTQKHRHREHSGKWKQLRN